MCTDLCEKNTSRFSCKHASSKHIKCKVDWKDDCKLENTVKQSQLKHLGELHKEWTEAGVSAQESPRSDIFRKRATKPLLKQKRRQKHLTWAKEKKNWTKVLFSDESKCCNSFGNQGPRVWRKSGEAQNVTWSPGRSFHSQWWFGLPCHLLVLVHCVFWSPQ